MKKSVLFLSFAALLLSLTCAGLAAEAQPGDEVTVTLYLNNTNAAYVRVMADYDRTAFDLIGYSAVSGTAGIHGIVAYDTGALPSGPVGTVTLRVKENAVPGTYTVSGELMECYDIDENEGKASVSGASFTVTGGASPTPTASPTAAPTAEPTAAPTAVPTAEPTIAPTAVPTAKPTIAPTAVPTAVPTIAPTAAPTAVPTAEPTAKPEEKPGEADWRYGQSVSTLGIRFRDVKPEVTNKWYMFTPLDLSRDGVQAIDLIAANVCRVGKVIVRVNGGKVSVEDRVNRSVDKLSLEFTLLPDLAGVTSAEISGMKAYAFGQEISIADDLGGDTKVLLFVSGLVNYDFNDAQTELVISGEKYQELVKQLQEIMD